MLEFFLKYKIAKIIPMQESFFHSSILPKNLKLSKELVSLNYEKLSPFKNPLIITYAQQKMLYLWFTKMSVAEELFLVPEAFLLYTLLRNKEDGIYVYDTEPRKILVIKERKLTAAFTSSQSDDISLDVFKDEYQVESHFSFSKEVFEQNLSFAIKKLNFSDLYRFLQLSIDKDDIKKLMLDKLTYPLVSLLVIYMVVSYTQSYFMEQKIESLTQKYHHLKNQNTKVKQTIRDYNADVKRYKYFAKTELTHIDPYKIIYDMYHIITKKDKATIKSIDISNNTLRLLISTKEDAIKYLKKLNNIEYFKNVVLQNTHKNRDGTKTISYFIELKEI